MVRESVIERAQAMLVECETEARAQGLEGDYAPTAGDLEHVTDTLGTKLTADEWRRCGLGWVGSNHVLEAE